MFRVKVIDSTVILLVCNDLNQLNSNFGNPTPRSQGAFLIAFVFNFLDERKFLTSPSSQLEKSILLIGKKMPTLGVK